MEKKSADAIPVGEGGEGYRYRAFISYSSKDRSAAEKLQRSLESYRIPRPLRRSGIHRNERVSPIFRDRSDLKASADLGQTIKDALENSEYLIVLCSPAAANSKWVDKEISFFKELGRSDNIIAVIVRGVPAVNHPVREPEGAFPKALVGLRSGDGSLTEPLAADIQEPTDGRGGDGFNLAKLKIVATLLGVSLAELTQRQAEVDRRQRRVAQAVAAGMLILAVVAGIGAWIALEQSRMAERRLQNAVESAARQIGATVRYRDRYGVPSEVIEELLRSAEVDFGKLISDDETSPMLVFQRARLNLELAELLTLVDDEQSQQKVTPLIVETAATLDRLEQRYPSVLEWIGLASAPDPAAIAMLRLKLLDAEGQERTYAGNFNGAIAAAQSRVTLSEAWLSKTGSLSWHRELAQGHCRLGAYNYQRGKLAASAAAYEKCLETTRSLIQRRHDPSDRGDLMAALSSLATTLVEMDRRSDALLRQREAAETAKALVSAEPQNTEYQRTELVTLTRLGDMVLSVEMDVSRSLNAYEQALLISDKLTRSDSSRLDWQRDRSLLLERLASAHLRLADNADVTRSFENLRQAEQYARDAFEIAERILNNDPLNQEWLRDRSVLEERQGQIAFATYKHGGDTRKLEDSARWYAKAIADRRVILKADAERSFYKLDLAVVLVQFGEVAMETREYEQAERSLREALLMSNDLISSNEAQPIWLREVATVHAALAKLYQKRENFADALAEIQRAIALIRDLRRKFPDIVQYRRDEEYLVGKQSELAKLAPEVPEWPQP
ncbi:toll/interleukin-1 receptor domain-containing protein [Sinorhizobium prairiense]|uniref:toll/interleukin-1 receptor domain-containing protein n=2 Tax=Sinorhizobium TaxID=28105 RepID=UPI0023D7F72F|nr:MULTISPECIES: toll/interleukin-1 receptor domain-containing protein [unclassified Sinorhizobium]WEJ12344.1 toll/interleukin-1 receptor domain-containing protein [Sinorhizobium sp. M103]WEJ17769.1 toll/interleukin-1 receptor domain-containing protein [Sinorhizobium sp. K101]WEJ40731.1 toll/interleukin-1 receptor domain-containing protein [Sinorhizobium sp. C101]